MFVLALPLLVRKTRILQSWLLCTNCSFMSCLRPQELASLHWEHTGGQIEAGDDQDDMDWITVNRDRLASISLWHMLGVGSWQPGTSLQPARPDKEGSEFEGVSGLDEGLFTTSGTAQGLSDSALDTQHKQGLETLVSAASSSAIAVLTECS